MNITAGLIKLKRVYRFLGHLKNKIPLWWDISKVEYQLDSIWATDDEGEHLIVCEEIRKAKERIEKRLPKTRAVRTGRTKRV